MDNKNIVEITVTTPAKEIAARQNKTYKMLYKKFMRVSDNPTQEFGDARLFAMKESKLEKVLVGLKLKDENKDAKNKVIFKIRCAEHILGGTKFTQEEYEYWYTKLLEQRIKLDKKVARNASSARAEILTYLELGTSLFSNLYHKWLEKRAELKGNKHQGLMTIQEEYNAFAKIINMPEILQVIDERVRDKKEAREGEKNRIVYQIQMAEYVTGATLNQKEFDVVYKNLMEAASKVDDVRDLYIPNKCKDEFQLAYTERLTKLVSALYEKYAKENAKEEDREQDGGRE